MKKQDTIDNGVVHSDVPSQKKEKLGFVQYFIVRRHSRVLYLPLDATIVRLHDIQKGDIIKASLLEVRKGPRPEEPIREMY